MTYHHISSYTFGVFFFLNCKIHIFCTIDIRHHRFPVIKHFFQHKYQYNRHQFSLTLFDFPFYKREKKIHFYKSFMEISSRYLHVAHIIYIGKWNRINEEMCRYILYILRAFISIVGHVRKNGMYVERLVWFYDIVFMVPLKGFTKNNIT